MKKTLALALSLLLAFPASAEPPGPCKDPNVRPGACKVPERWICLSPELASADVAAREAARQRCEAEKRALAAEASTVLRRELGKVEAEREALSTKLALALDAASRAEEAAREAEEEASSRWTTWEVFGMVAGGVAAGALAGALAAYYAGR